MATFKESTPTPTQRFMAFSQRMSSDLNVVGIDHCYAKPWSSHPDASNARPLQTLFVERYVRQSPIDQQRSEDDLVDVVGEETGPPALYDVSKARAMMSDCDRHASLLRPDFSDTKEDWEDHFASVRTAWSVQQNRIFAKVMKVLQADRLARLSIVDSKNEPIQRRLQIDKASKRIRFAFGNIGWEKTLILWLHNLLLDKLRGQLLTSYLEILQKLKAKIPSLIDRLIEGTSSKQGTLASESLAGLLKRNWDPVTPSINQQKLKKLPDNPLLLLIPGAPMASNPNSNKRYKFWQNQLASMGKVINVVPINSSTSKSVINCVESMVATTRSKILEMKGHFPGRLIVLIGWNVGALVAVHVSLVEAVHAVVCLGFPTMGTSGNRGEVDDPIYNCKTPTLFVVGQHASATNLDCLEDIRERLRVETGLLLVGGADDQLRMSRAKKRNCSLTQAMVDRCIMEEMFEFLGNALFQVIVQPENTEEVEVTKKQPKKRKLKDLSSTAGSQTVDNIVKPPKKIRSMKMANVGTAAFTGHSLDTGKKGAPRKRLGKVSAENRGTVQKPFLHLTLPVITSTPGEKPPASTPSLSEAAAIASAPELSTLLQSIKTSTEQAMASAAKSAAPFISSKISSAAATSLLASSSSSVPTTTALTLSKFLASSSFLKCVPSSDLSLDDPVSTFDSKSSSDPLSDVDLEELSGKEDSPVKSQPQQQPQILIRAGLSSAPFSIPLTFSMASKMLKSGASMKLASSGSSASSQQIHQLLTSSTKSNVPASMSQNTQICDELSAMSSSSSVPASSGAIISLDHLSQPFSSPSKSSGNSVSLASMADMPKASVINIGNDTVYLKENPPSNTSAPGTVSIDLGQIASGNSGSAVKLQSSSRISLIPSVKHIPMSISSSVSSSPERAQLSSPVPFSRGNQQVTSLNKPQPRFALSSSGVQLPNNTAASQVSAPRLLQSPTRLGFSGLRGSQLLSTLSSSTGVIRFKVTSQADSNTAETKQTSLGRDETDGHADSVQPPSDPFAKASKLPAFIDLTDDIPPTSKQSTKTVTAFAGSQTLSLLSLKTTGKNALPNSIFTSSSNLKSASNQSSLQTIISGSDTPPGSDSQFSSNSKPKMDTTITETGREITSVNLKQPAAADEKELASQIEDLSSIPSSPPTPSSSAPSPSPKTLSSPSAPSTLAKSNKSSISYTAKPKPVLTSVASTRTRRIKVPKQYDL